MSYTSDREQARQDRAAALRHKKSILDRLSYSVIVNELDDISAGCSDMMWFDNDEITELLGQDGESDNEFRIIATSLYDDAERLRRRLDDYDINETIFNDVMTAAAGENEQRYGYDSYLDEECLLSDYECKLAKEAANSRFMKHTKEQILKMFGECFDIALKWLDITQGFDYLNATLGVMKDDKTAILKAIQRVNDAYDRAAEWDFLGDKAREFDRIISDLPVDVWAI